MLVSIRRNLKTKHEVLMVAIEGLAQGDLTWKKLPVVSFITLPLFARFHLHSSAVLLVLKVDLVLNLHYQSGHLVDYWQADEAARFVPSCSHQPLVKLAS